MPVFNETQNLNLEYRVFAARNFLTRLAGLLGTYPPDRGKALYITPCNGVHTFGMRYPVDIAFLDSEDRVVKLILGLRPNRMTGIIRSAESALEFSSDTLAEGGIRVGDILKVEADEDQRPDWGAFERLLHWPANVFIAAFWFLFVYSSFLRWQQTGQVSSLGLMAVNAVLCVLFLTRRESQETSHRVADWVIAFVTVALSMLLRPHPTTNSTLAAVSLPVQAVGIVALIGALLSLGRSFGVVPANRGIKTAGLYRLVRHPIYTSELIFYGGFLVGNLSGVNSQLVILIVVGQVYRLLSEERLLSRNDQYRDYMRTVRFRLVPGVF
jgi:protein-S-isoprenylcysteine O-methyltransferase Ste14